MNSGTRIGQAVKNAYDKPAINDAVKRIHEIADQRGVTGHEIALRWILHHSMLDGDRGDSIVIGARTIEQLEGTLGACKNGGPLEEDVLALVERCWEEIERSGESTHYSSFAPKAGEALRP
jgi:aflatoxin B1 aldehyde reductase